MHMPATQLVKHRRKTIREKVTDMQLNQRDVDMAERCKEMGLILYVREGDVLVKEVENFKFLWRPLDQTYYS